MTKVYTLSVLFSLFALFASAQFTVGQKVVGGNIGLNVNNSKRYSYYDDYNQTGVSVSPSVAWFMRANQLFGVGLFYNYNHQRITVVNAGSGTDTTTSYNHSIGASLFSQRFITIARNFYFTITASGFASYNFGDMSHFFMGYETITKQNGYSINASLAPGLSYRVSQRFLFDAYLSNLLNANFTHNQYKDASSETSHQNSFNLTSNLTNTYLGNIGFGFRWLLKK